MRNKYLEGKGERQVSRYCRTKKSLKMYSTNLHLNQLPLPQNKGTFILHSPPKCTETHVPSLSFLFKYYVQSESECVRGINDIKQTGTFSFSPPCICRMDCFRSRFLLCLILSSHQGRGGETVPAVHFVNFPSPQTHNVHTPCVTLDHKTRHKVKYAFN